MPSTPHEGAYPQPEVPPGVPGAPGTERMPPPQGPPGGGYPPQGYGQPGYGRHRPGPGISERASEVATAVNRHIRTPETKPFYMTSEFLVWMFCVVGVMIAGAATSTGVHGDVLRASTVWTVIAVISFAYIISRGISKAGTKYRDHDRGGYDGY